MKRVVITGLGAITPLGNDVSEFMKNVFLGKSGAGPITRFDPGNFRTRFACEVKKFDPGRYLSHAEIKRTDLFTQFALGAASQALSDSGLDLLNMSPYDIGVIWGTGQGGMATFESEVAGYVENQYHPRFNPFFVPRIIANMASGMISIKFGLQGINYTTVSACATGNTALMDAFTYLRIGKAKAFVAGSSEAPITPASIGGFNSMKALSICNERPEQASRPFDKDRDGFVMGEGAGALILEEYEHARKRGAKIYGELIGAAMTADAYHMTSTHPEGAGAAKAMELALQEAQINASEVDYLNTHATSTPTGDLSEVQAIASVFSSAENLRINSTKAMTGHLLGAAGAIEAIICLEALQTSQLPPTINLENRDPEIPGPLKFVSDTSPRNPLKVVMSNSFGFGGHNSTVIFKKI